MRETRRLLPLAALLLVGSLGLSQQAESEVTVKQVKYDQLGDVIRQLRGKVIAVDFWADT